MIKNDYTIDISSLSAKISTIKTKMDKYQTILDNLNSLYSDLPVVKNNLNDAINKCLDGGFVDKGNPFGNGTMEESKKDIEYIINELDTIKSNITNKINSLRGELDTLNRKMMQLKSSEV